MESTFQHPPVARIAILYGDAVAAACAISAGAHAALVPSHGAPAEAGAGIRRRHRPASGRGRGVALFPVAARAALAGALLFAGLIVLHVAATTVGIPLLSPEPEPVDGVTLATKSVESAGLVFALKLNQTVSGRRPTTFVRR